MDEIECVVVGAGVVGLAAARALALLGREVVVLEAEGLIGSQTSSRNSEVIHAGIYYPKGSAKARLCVQGREMLYAFCAARGSGAGTSIPASAASSLTASMNSSPRWSVIQRIASPCAPQPKQW